MPAVSTTRRQQAAAGSAAPLAADVDRMPCVADLGREALGGVGGDPRGPGELRLGAVGVLQEYDHIGRTRGVDGELEQARKGRRGPRSAQ